MREKEKIKEKNEMDLFLLNSETGEILHGTMKINTSTERKNIFFKNHKTIERIMLRMNDDMTGFINKIDRSFDNLKELKKELKRPFGRIYDGAIYGTQSLIDGTTVYSEVAFFAYRELRKANKVAKELILPKILADKKREADDLTQKFLKVVTEIENIETNLKKL